MYTLIALSVCLLMNEAAGPQGTITGVAVNGTAGGVPLADCQIVLRASENGSFVPIAETRTDSDGRFAFTGLHPDGKVIYLPGANRHDVHYPGVRVRLQPNQCTANVKLIAFDAVESPSPLVIRRHEIQIRPAAEFIAVTETLVVDNPTLTAYVGQATDDRPPVTLRQSLPDKLEQITFEKEFHGRNFRLEERILSTDLPWRPGKQELKFMYRLPIDQKHQLFSRRLDRPTEHVLVRVVEGDDAELTCNIPRAKDGPDHAVTYEYREASTPLPEGHLIELHLGSAPIGFGVYARWTAALLLGALMLGTVRVAYRRRSRSPQHDDLEKTIHRNKRSVRRKSHRLASRH